MLSPKSVKEVRLLSSCRLNLKKCRSKQVSSWLILLIVNSVPMREFFFSLIKKLSRLYNAGDHLQSNFSLMPDCNFHHLRCMVVQWFPIMIDEYYHPGSTSGPVRSSRGSIALAFIEQKHKCLIFAARQYTAHRSEFS